MVDVPVRKDQVVDGQSPGAGMREDTAVRVTSRKGRGIDGQLARRSGAVDGQGIPRDGDGGSRQRDLAVHARQSGEVHRPALCGSRDEGAQRSRPQVIQTGCNCRGERRRRCGQREDRGNAAGQWLATRLVDSGQNNASHNALPIDDGYCTLPPNSIRLTQAVSNEPT